MFCWFNSIIYIWYLGVFFLKIYKHPDLIPQCRIFACSRWFFTECYYYFYHYCVLHTIFEGVWVWIYVCVCVFHMPKQVTLSRSLLSAVLIDHYFLDQGSQYWRHKASRQLWCTPAVAQLSYNPTDQRPRIMWVLLGKTDQQRPNQERFSTKMSTIVKGAQSKWIKRWMICTEERTQS